MSRRSVETMSDPVGHCRKTSPEWDAAVWTNEPPSVMLRSGRNKPFHRASEFAHSEEKKLHSTHIGKLGGRQNKRAMPLPDLHLPNP
jgi:hypothetical protein